MTARDRQGAPPVFDSITTHVDVPDEPLPLTGPQVRDVIVAVPPTASEADRELPLNAAVMVAVWSVAAAATLTVNVVEVAFGATETEAGTVRMRCCSKASPFRRRSSTWRSCTCSTGRGPRWQGCTSPK